MTIDEAIITLQVIKETGIYEGDPDDSQAILLGIEALKLVQALLLLGKGKFKVMLPGEIEETK